MERISVIGAGYVGLVTAAGFAEKGHQVICVDNDEKKIAKIKNGILPIFENDLDNLVRSVTEKGHLSFTTDTATATQASDLHFLCVGTPHIPGGGYKLDYILSAAKTIGVSLSKKKENIIV